jgi:Uma2 family endonuclease
MNIHAAIKLPTTPDEFLRWNEDREGKREFVEGKIVEMMVNTTRYHATLSMRFANEFLNQLSWLDFVVTSADFGIKTFNTVRYPDVMVERAGGDGKALATTEPMIIVEVLSPSTRKSDLGQKRIQYQAIPSLLHYLAVEQDQAKILLWSRLPDGEWSDMIEVAVNASFTLSGLNVTIDPAKIYAGIV